MNSQKVLITGGNSGIGLAISNLFLDRGFQVFSASRNDREYPKHKNFHYSRLDLCDLGAVSEFGRRFIQEHGVPDILINNAGYGAFFEWRAFEEDQIIQQANVLFIAPSLLCRTFAPAMAKKKKGTIMNITSLATLFPLPYMPLYNSSKSALSALTSSLMLEYEEFPRFLDFRIGDVRTDFNKSSLQQEPSSQSSSMKSAWLQIEKQLGESPTAKIVAGQILTAYKRKKQGIVYGGSFLHATIAPIVYKILGQKGLRFLLHKRYFG